MRDRKKVDLYGRVVGRELRCVEGEETNQDNLNEKKNVFNKRGNCN